MAEQTMQYQIEVQEGAGNGEVVIIYNCDSAEITPELLANTLTELSKQAATQQNVNEAINPNAGQIQEYIVHNDTGNVSGQFELSLMNLPSDLKGNDSVIHAAEQALNLEGNQLQNGLFLQNPVASCERLEGATEGLDNGLFASTEQMHKYLDNNASVSHPGQIDTNFKSAILSSEEILKSSVTPPEQTYKSLEDGMVFSMLEQMQDRSQNDFTQQMHADSERKVNSIIPEHISFSKSQDEDEKVTTSSSYVDIKRELDMSPQINANKEHIVELFHKKPIDDHKDERVASNDIKTEIEVDPVESSTLHICHYCGLTSNVEIEFQRHLKTEHGEEEPFQCGACQKSFKVELSLQIHYLVHGGSPGSPVLETNLLNSVQKAFKCPLCDFEYKSKIRIRNHANKEHTDQTIYKCSKCPYTCLDSEDLEFHEKSPNHDDEMKESCPKCGIVCKNVKRHIKIAHNDSRPFLCNECGFRAKSITNLNAHKVIHSDVKEVKCPQCEYRCHTKNHLDRHMVKHSTFRKYKCPFPDCEFASKTKSSLKRHEQIHSSGIKHICPICEYCAVDRAELKKHKILKHPRVASYNCKECGVSYDRVSELKKHALAVHKSTKVCFCAYCDYSTETQHALRDHMQIHYGKYSYSCSICGYTCRLKSLYKRHMARHNKDKKFACALCTYACEEKADLQKHLTSKHSHDKPYSCLHCSYKCKFQARLNNHVAYVHSDVKPFFCTLCSYSGKSAENLRKHQATHTGMVKMIQCVLCEYATAEKAKLKRHMQVHIKRAVFQ